MKRLSVIAVHFLLCLYSALSYAQTGNSSSGSQLYFPENIWEEESLENIGWNTVLLEHALSYAEQNKSSSVVVLHNGRIVAQRFWHFRDVESSPMLIGYDDEGFPIEDVASLQKAVVSALVGMAVKKQLLSINDPVFQYLGKGWSKASEKQEQTILIRHLLSMSSGLSVSGEFEAVAGTKWFYNTRVYSFLLQVLERAAGEDIHTITRQWLTDKLAMTNTYWRQRPWANNSMNANALGLATNAKDMAKFGLLMLAEGNWNGEQLIDAQFFQQSIHPSQSMNPAYGFLWWLNGKQMVTADGSTNSYSTLAPAAPADLFAGLGAGDRTVFVVPSMNVVVVRLGEQAGDGFRNGFWRRLMQASSRNPLCVECKTPIAAKESTKKNSAGKFISWREHIIDDPTLGVPDLSGSDGLAMADLDNDGYEDIVSVHESDTVYDGAPIGHVRIAWGGASPEQWQLQTLASGSEAAAAEDVSLADVNGDGLIDVVVACELAPLLYLQNPGDKSRRTRWTRTAIEISKDRGSYIRAFLADFNGDGKVELVAANKGEQNPDPSDAQLNSISLYLPGNDPLVGADWTEQILGQVKIPINSEPVDLDGDGDLDVIAGSRAERRVLWFENLNDLNFKEHAINVPDAPQELSITGFNMVYKDLNGDKRLDIISTAWPGSIVGLIQPDNPADNWQFGVIGAAPPDQLVSVALADIDNDGDEDIFTGAYSRGPRDRDGEFVSVNEPVGRIAWFENPGKNTYTNWLRHDIARPKRGMYDKWLARDIDRDGDIDFVGTRGNSEPYDGVIWLEQMTTEKAAPVFTSARKVDSEQLSLPE